MPCERQKHVKEKQRNMRDALLINGECITNAVRSLLPIKTLNINLLVIFNYYFLKVKNLSKPKRY